MPSQLVPYFTRQSNKGNWSYQGALRGSNNQPLWTTLSSGLVVSLVAVDRRGRALFQISSDDGTGQLSLGANGSITIDVLPDTITAADEGLYDIHVTASSDGFTYNRVFGRLPLYEGFTPTSSTSGASAVGPKVHVWQLKIELVNESVLATVEAAILPATNNPANILWTSSGETVVGDALYDLIKGILGWNTTQMATLYANASGILSVA